MAEATIIPYQGKGERMTREEAIRRLSGILTEAVESENSVCYVTEEDREPLEMAIKALEEQRTGHWIEGGYEEGVFGFVYTRYKCSCCGWEHSLLIPKNYCPNCGAKTASPTGEEVEE